MQKIISKGKCRICKKEFPQSGIKKHISSCGKNNGKEKVFLIKAEAGPFWVYFEIEAKKTLKQLDRFLRDLWLECCGHLSVFIISGQRHYSHDIDLEIGDKTMEAKLLSVISPGLKFGYEYDFGTTTELSLDCITEKNGNKGINIIARNEPIGFKCEKCGAKADEVCVYCVLEGRGFVCNKCSKKHKCEEPYFLPVVNSPRFGMCGFTGEECSLLNK